MSRDELLWQALQRTQATYDEHSGVFNAVDYFIDQAIADGEFYNPDEPIDCDISAADVVFSYLGKLNSISPVVHDRLLANLDELTMPIGRICTLRLLQHAPLSGNPYYVEIPRAVVLRSGLAPSVGMRGSLGFKVRPYLEIAPRNIDAHDFRFGTDLLTFDHEMRPRFTIPWIDISAIALNRV